ncbi:GSKIP domain-containing protein [Scheffersomyces amazonensis]|uniref:GSKIP domain-containing protein n=1 Tax=Scheffersomyces amazonensis TaxID=1078765 RepID=UPI00315CE9AF
MDSKRQTLELSTIHREYNSFFPKCDLHVSTHSPRTSISITNNSDDIYARILNKKENVSKVIDNNYNYITIETEEDQILHISVSLSGWYKLETQETETQETETQTQTQIQTVQQTQKYYETFEALMNSLSPRFQTRFGNVLSDKLSSLLEQKLQDDYEYSNNDE